MPPDGAQRRSRVLIVDNEKNVLTSLRRLLRHEHMDLLLATSTSEALKMLSEHKVDLVMSEMRMEGMDGATFLKLVKQKYPRTVRVILTGHAERVSVTAAFTEADVYQLVAKPWNDEELKEVLRSALQHSEGKSIKEDGLGRLLNEIDSLPSLPTVYVALREALRESEEGSTDRVAEVVGEDPAIAARTLRIANSAFFGQRRQVDSIQRAIGLIGLVMIENIVLAASVFRDLEADDIPGFSQADFWRHSLACGMIAKRVEESRSGDRQQAEMAMLAGTLHDLGKLVFARFFHDVYVDIVNVAQRDEESISVKETELLGIGHTVLGGHLADFWNMPTPIVEAISCHNDPSVATIDPELSAIIHLSDVFVHRAGIGRSGSGKVPDIHPSLYGILALDEAQLEQLEIHVADSVNADSVPA